MWHQTPVSPEDLDLGMRASPNPQAARMMPSAPDSGAMARPLPQHQPVNLTDAVSAADHALCECLTLYIPGKDKDGNPIDQAPWIEEALAVLAQIGGRANVLPPVESAWLNPETGMLIQDSVVLAYTYIDPEHFEPSLAWLRGFLHRLGRQTGQAEVAFEFADRLYKIRHFDRG
jgi:hypothetical protein